MANSDLKLLELSPVTNPSYAVHQHYNRAKTGNLDAIQDLLSLAGHEEHAWGQEDACLTLSALVRDATSSPQRVNLSPEIHSRIISGAIGIFRSVRPDTQTGHYLGSIIVAFAKQRNPAAQEYVHQIGSFSRLWTSRNYDVQDVQ